MTGYDAFLDNAGQFFDQAFHGAPLESLDSMRRDPWQWWRRLGLSR
jgi:hypothetical protein